jgi:hypothetical protein
MELGGLFKEFTEIFNSLKNSVSDIYAKIKLLSTSLVETNNKIDNNNKSTLAEIEDIREKSNNLNKIVLKELSDIKKEYNLQASAKEDEIKLLKNDIKELKQLIIKNNNDFISYKTSTDIYIKDIEKLLSNNVDDKIKNLIVKNSELFNDINNLKPKLLSLEEQYNYILKLEKNNSQEFSSYKKDITENLATIREIISTTTIRKKDLLKTLQEDGNIDLLYNLKLTPRVLPKTVVNGLLIVDAKDGKLKYGYNDKWKIV